MSIAYKVKLNNPAVLTWARKEMGLEVHDIADFFSKREAEIISWEKGEDGPTFRQLESLANKLKRPISAFFLPTVPPPTEPPEDHRTMPGIVPGKFTTKSRLAFRELRNMLSETRELLDDLGQDISYSLPTWSMGNNPDQLANTLRAEFGITLEMQTKFDTHYAALDAWRDILFDHGVIVRICRMPIKDVRAFCLYGYDLAGIGLSSEEREHGRIFSLFHEVCHLCLSLPGVSGLTTKHRKGRQNPNQVLEQYCDQFAAAFLLPISDTNVRDSLRSLGNNFSLESAQRFANHFKTSKYVVARKAFDLGYINNDLYWSEINRWTEEDKQRKSKSGGGDYNVTQVSHLGKRFVGLVFTAVNRGIITSVQASRLTGIKPLTIEAMR